MLSLPLPLWSSPVPHTHTHTLKFSPSHKYCNLHINEPGRSVEQECNSYFLLFSELLFLHFDFLCPPPADSPPLSACFYFSEEAHANSAWTEQHHFIKSSAKHVRRCLLEVALAQVRALNFTFSAWTASGRSCETAWGFFWWGKWKGEGLYLEDFLSAFMLHCPLVICCIGHLF